MNSPLVSFIVPVYNAQPYLHQCIDSLLSQTFADIEVILVDDGSTDNSFAICQEYAAQHSSVHAMTQKNGGVSAARNAGIEKSNGKWLCFVDADDWIAPNYAELVRQHGADNDLVYFSYAEVLPNKTLPHTGDAKSCVLYGTAITELQKATLNHDHKGGGFDPHITHTTGPCLKAYRHEIIRQYALRFPQGIISGEDTYFNFRFLLYAKKVELVPEIVYFYRKNAASVTQRWNPALKDNYARILKLYQELFAESKAWLTFREVWLLYCVSCCMFITLQDFCHPKNPASYPQRKKMFNALCSDPIYDAALAQAELKHFSFAKMLVCSLIKHRAFWALNSLCRCRAIFLKLG